MNSLLKLLETAQINIGEQIGIVKQLCFIRPDKLEQLENETSVLCDMLIDLFDDIIAETHRIENDDEKDNLKKIIRQQQLALESKNKKLDALHYVWCNGGCDTGVHRWNNQSITEDIVIEAEQNTKRLREWFENNKK